MAWSHYTGLLASGDVLTDGMLEELHSALRERSLAAYNTATLGTSPLDDIITKRMVSDGISAVTRLAEKIVTYSESFNQSDTSALPYETSRTGNNVLWAAASSLGMSSADFLTLWPSGDVFNPGRVSSAMAWNIIREAIRLLKYVRYPFSVTSGSGENKDYGGISWADTLDRFYAFGVTSTSGGRHLWAKQGSNDSARMVSARWGYDITVPNETIFSDGHSISVFVQGSAGALVDVYVPATIRIMEGATTMAEITFSSTPLQTVRTTPVSPSITTGARQFTVEYAAWSERAYASEVQPQTKDETVYGSTYAFVSGAASGNWAIIEPTFQYP